MFIILFRKERKYLSSRDSGTVHRFDIASIGLTLQQNKKSVITQNFIR